MWTDAQYQATQQLIQRVQQLQPKWSLTAYESENSFYRSEEYRRQQAREQQAREVRIVQQARQQYRQDSSHRAELRVLARLDSTRRAGEAIAQARADSTWRVGAAARAQELNVALLTPAGRRAMTTAAAPARRPRPAAGPAAYYCASGNAVKYHSSPTCRGLSRCAASVERISLREAQQSMDACKFCH